MSTSPQALRARNLRTVAALAALFLAPLALSFWMYYGKGWHPAGRTNHGELFEPARPLPDAAQFGGKWSLVYIAAGSCDADCRNALYVMRQTHLSLNQQMSRVSRVFLATDPCCDREFLQREHPGLTIVPTAADPQGFPAHDRATSLFIVDPLGNLVMRYDVRGNPKGLLEDLKKLLQLSHIG